MPRGIPNAKRDESAMRYTLFHVPLPPNPKHVGTHYLRSESQTLWSRNASRTSAANKNKSVADETGNATPSEGRRGSKVLVIHPGSRFLRIGRASDVNPVSVPNVIARKHKPPVPAPSYIEGISRPLKDASHLQTTASTQNVDEYAVPLASDDPFDMKVAAITISLRDRMRFYKLRVTPNAASIASTFNEQFVPEAIPEINDPFRIDWIQKAPDDDYLVGEKALHLADPASLGYVVRWPVYGGKFNTRDYQSNQSILGDIETILRVNLKEKLEIDASSFKDYSVVLVIPDFYDRSYVRDLVRMLLVSMGFKQLCAQQESLAATYGAGISNACVVDMGAAKTSIACVDDGLVLPDTRMSLNMGGDDITEFLYVLLEKISFPYKDADLARWYDWNVMEDLKARLCTLLEGDVALNLYDFVVRRPGRPTEKYGLRAYDEIILAPMCLFEPRVIEFDQKRVGTRPISHPDVSGDIVEQVSDHFTQAMVISTQHLLPPAPPPELPLHLKTLPPLSPQIPDGSQSASAVSPQPVQGDTPTPATGTSDTKEATPTATTIAPTSTVGEGTVDVPMEIVDNDEVESKPPDTAPADTPVGPAIPDQPTPTFPGGYTIDVCFEASKLPLDVAIFNSARAAGGDEKIRKYLQAVLVIGGTALVPGMAHALESRYSMNFSS
ncbi:hypothetical protein AcV5_009185 [Taiwanofungus camphoratus]|nr:hypothetical protein AcV5_009185 [Antrodia cinnamomea]KAI0924484.1 hypothetical protein AcW2_005359 [Antrodia cinnamomea]